MGYFAYPPSTMTLIFEWVMAVVLSLFVLMSVGSLCLLLGAKAGAAIAEHRHAKRLAAVPIETDAERLVAQHKRINMLERTAEQPLSVWQEEDGFIGTYANDGSRIWGEGVKRPDEVEVMSPGQRYTDSPLPRAEPIVTGALGNVINEPFPVGMGPDRTVVWNHNGSQRIEVLSHPQGRKTLYEVRIPIEMDPAVAHVYALDFVSMVHENDPQSRYTDVALTYGPYIMASSWRESDWRDIQWRDAKRRYEIAIIQAHGIPSCNILPIHSEGVAKPVAYAPSGCQCGVCGPDLGPLFDRMERDMSPQFALNRAEVHEMYRQEEEFRRAQRQEAGNAILERRPKVELMPPELRQVWKDHADV